MKFVKLLILFMLVMPIGFAAVSQESFFSVGSDFLVLQNPKSDPQKLPEIYALYDNTNIQLDINNDGAYDYSYSINKGGPSMFNPEWSIVSGTRIHSDKPIHYVQDLYNYDVIVSDISSYKHYYAKKLTTVPMLQSLKQEYYVKAETWQVVPTGSQMIFLDENIDGTIDKNLSLDRFSGEFACSNFCRMYSDKPFIAFSSEGIASPLSTGFLSNEKKIYVISGNGANIGVDFNNDGTIDETYSVGKGASLLNSSEGARITSDNPVAAYGYEVGSGTPKPKTYFALPPLASVTDEASLPSMDRNQSIIGAFGSASLPGSEFIVLAYGEDFGLIDAYNLTNGKKMNLTSDYFYVDSDAPVIDSYFYDYNQGANIKYYTGHTIAYYAIYLTANTRKAIPNDTTTISVRVINPSKEISAKDISVKFKVNNYFSMPIAEVYARKGSLSGGAPESLPPEAVTLADDFIEKYFVYTYTGTLDPQSYLDIDVTLATPQDEGIFYFSPAELAYTAPTWII